MGYKPGRPKTLAAKRRASSSAAPPQCAAKSGKVKSSDAHESGSGSARARNQDLDQEGLCIVCGIRFQDHVIENCGG